MIETIAVRPRVDARPGYQVPLVDRQDQCLAALARVRQNLRVLVRHSFDAVDDVNDEVAAVDRAERMADAESLDAMLDPRFTPDTRGID